MKMSNCFTTDLPAKSETLNSSSILRIYEQNMMLIFKEIKSNEPKLTQKKSQNNSVIQILLLSDRERN